MENYVKYLPQYEQLHHGADPEFPDDDGHHSSHV